MMKDNLTEIKGKPDEMRAAVESFKRNLPSYVEMAAVMAEIRRAHYDAYVKQGFTENQALELCKKITL